MNAKSRMRFMPKSKEQKVSPELKKKFLWEGAKGRKMNIQATYFIYSYSIGHKIQTLLPHSVLQ